MWRTAAVAKEHLWLISTHGRDSTASSSSGQSRDQWLTSMCGRTLMWNAPERTAVAVQFPAARAPVAVTARPAAICTCASAPVPYVSASVASAFASVVYTSASAFAMLACSVACTSVVAGACGVPVSGHDTHDSLERVLVFGKAQAQRLLTQLPENRRSCRTRLTRRTALIMAAPRAGAGSHLASSRDV